jgi:dephospho-CoA kinase
MIIGVTGGIGSGKSEVTRRFQALGIHVVDADQVAREVVELNSPALEAITLHFGKNILTATGTLDRAKLRSIIFSNPAEKTWLEQLLHPIINTEINRQLQAAKSIYVILVSPLLLETNQDKLVDRVLVVDASEAAQIDRTQKRDRTTSEQINAIMSSQMSRHKRCKKADDIIKNNGDMLELDRQVKNMHEKYVTLLKDNTRNDH